MIAKLVVMLGKAEGREIPLPASQFIVGRGPTCHLRPHSEQVSKVHCAIGRRAGHIVVRDLQSRNKTYVNDEPIRGTVRVQDRDVLTVGPLKFRFSITDSPDQPVREDQVLWLMDSALDAFDVESTSDTVVMKIPSSLLEENDEEPRDAGDSHVLTDASAEEGDVRLSAGRYLRSYLDARKREATMRPVTVVGLQQSQIQFLDDLRAALQRGSEARLTTREEVLAVLIDAVVEMGHDFGAVGSLLELKAMLVGEREE